LAKVPKAEHVNIRQERINPAMIHLKSIQLRKFADMRVFPYNLSLLQSLKELHFEAPVTLLVGENGTWKSTLHEALAFAADMVGVGSENTRNDKSLIHARKLAKYFKLSWTKRTHKGFFLHAEDFIGCAKRLNQIRSEMESDLNAVEIEYKKYKQLCPRTGKIELYP
jgi:predicted ATPase